MSRTITDLTVRNSTKLQSDLTFVETTNDLTVVASDQTAGARSATIPDLTANDVFVFAAETQTLSNKTLSAPTVSGDIVFDEATNDLTLAVADQGTGTATATIPDLGGVSDDFVMRTLSQTVLNKIFDTTNVFGDAVDGTKQVGFDISGASSGFKTTLKFVQTAPVEITFPDADTIIPSTFLEVTGTDNQVVRMDGTGAIQNSTVTISDTGDLTVPGDLNVLGTTTTTSSTNVLAADNNVLLSAGYTTTTARSGGISVNFLPTAIADTSDTGGFATTSTVATTGAATFSAGDIVMVSGATNVSNNGIFQVLTHAANVLTINTTPAFNFLNSAFVVDATDVTAALTKINVAVLQAGSDGEPQIAAGSNVLSMAFRTLVTSERAKVADEYMLLNAEYTTASGVAGGIAVNYLPTATADTAAAGGFSSTSTIATTGAATFSAGDFVLVTGAANGANNGLYEVLTHAANVLTIDTTPSFGFSGAAFVVDPDDTSAALTLVNIAVLRASAAGVFEIANGSNTSLTFSALSANPVGSNWLEATLNTTNATVTTIATIPTTTNASGHLEVRLVARQDASTNTKTGELRRGFYNSAGALTAISFDDTLFFDSAAGPATWSLASSVSGANVLVRVTGLAATNIDWKIQYRYLEHIFS